MLCQTTGYALEVSMQTADLDDRAVKGALSYGSSLFANTTIVAIVVKG